MVSQKPVLIVIAGPNGSGKTTLTEQVIQHQWVRDCEYINPDAIAQGEFGDWNSPKAIMQAAQIATSRRERCLEQKQSLAFETVLSAPDKVDFVQRAKSLGFFVRVFFVGTDHPSINAARVTQRVMEGGHDVPIPKIISRYTKSIANCAALASFVDRLYLYDNSIEGRMPRLLLKISEDQAVKAYGNINTWANGILDSIGAPSHGSAPSDQDQPTDIRTEMRTLGVPRG